jgi:hypothetical protein
MTAALDQDFTRGTESLMGRRQGAYVGSQTNAFRIAPGEDEITLYKAPGPVVPTTFASAAASRPFTARVRDMLKISPLSSRMDAVIRYVTAALKMQDWAGATELLSCWDETRSFTTASTYICIISGKLFRFAQGSVAEIRSNSRHMPVGATGGPHLRFEFSPYSLIFFAILAH